MKKSVLIFLLAVLLPGIVLGWLALRNAREQQIILERRTAELYQSEADAAANAVRAIIDEQRRSFTDAIRKLLSTHEPQKLAQRFSGLLAEAWPRTAVGFAIGSDGRILSPTTEDAASNQEWKRFLWNNGQFISDQMVVTVFPVSVNDLARPDKMAKKSAETDTYDKQSEAAAPPKIAQDRSQRIANGRSRLASKPESSFSRAVDDKKDAEQKQIQVLGKVSAPSASTVAKEEIKNTAPMDAAQTQRQEVMVRNVAPQQMLAMNDRTAYSQLSWSTSSFSTLTAGATEGMITRFVQDRLEMIFWVRPERAPDVVFGCQIYAESLRDLWSDALPVADVSSFSSDTRPEYILTLLNDKAQPASGAPGAKEERDWKHPFVASEIGEALPHWEAALYLSRPEQLKESALKLRRTLYLLIAAALAAIACGGGLVVADTRRQVVLAQKKADFVSNVSHELKTPLTSIRMFSELMHSGRANPSRHTQYLRIIMVESERLTRLINNVLDFSRSERKQHPLEKSWLDLYCVLDRAWENHELHLQEMGFRTLWNAAPGPYPVIGDEDALAQILVNLLSNAEKYSGDHKEIELESGIESETVYVRVLDRGLGIPSGEEQKIFEAFYRAHDSLSSGIQGSGLGLTLAQRHAQEMSGSIHCEPRRGGGTIFTLRLPLANVLPLSRE